MPAMSPWGAFLTSAAVLFGPWALMPLRGRREIRGGVGVLWWVNAAYCAFWHRLEVGWDDPLPAEGPLILISNHTCCIDHMLLQASTRRLLGFLIAKELYEKPLFRPFCRIARCIPVRRDGNDVAATKAALRALAEGRVVPVFPEGRISPTSGREFGEGKPGVAFLALRAGVPVIPAYICGTPETRNVLGSYLTPSRARVRFGPPIDLSDLFREGKVDRGRVDEVTRRFMDALRALRDNPPEGETPGEDPSHGHRPDAGPGALPGGRPAVDPT